MARKRINEDAEEPNPSVHRPQLIVGMVAYNGARAIRQALQSVKGVADRVVVVEGKFEGREGHVRSTDETAQIAEDVGAEVIQPHTPSVQPEQRDKYLVGQPGDVYLVIDSDEALRGEFPKDKVLNGKAASYQIQIRGPASWSPYPINTIRVYRHIGEKPHHNPGQLLIDGEGRLMDGTHPNGFGGVLEGCWLEHLK